MKRTLINSLINNIIFIKQLEGYGVAEIKLDLKRPGETKINIVGVCCVCCILREKQAWSGEETAW